MGHQIEILFPRDERDTTPAYRLRNNGRTVPIPLGQRGFIAFDERAPPTPGRPRYHSTLTTTTPP
ncbi:hypothetical protein IU459_03670 [Nocardia amamiensis]|uniref:Uncharacterized protein n=1 Tax=Nocardia amamiensis TaxID=404578 RepID=A0ABS0CJ72_9NOCA|nr:hypothetical protein [Nocardia amamiensis]MBF6296640.1 hypothetical protein [Nocardia amamiensis]